MANCKNPTLKNVFCFHYRQRGHWFSKCKERKEGVGNKNGNGNNNNNKGKQGARVFAL